MIEVMAKISLLFLQGLSVRNLLDQWNQYGIFDLVLPFLLIMSLVFGILSTTKILGGNNGINLIIAMTIGLMALRLEFVSLFFTELFPRFAMGLAALLVGIILVGLFIPNEWKALRGWYIAFGIMGVVIAVITTVSTFSTFGYFGSFFWQEYTGIIVASVFVIAVIIGIVVSLQGESKDKPPQQYAIGPIRT